jgi:hypothetical protein
MKYLKTLAALSGALVLSSVLSSAQTVISSLPYTISTAGVYVLNQSLHYPSATGNAITISASNVTINLNGYGIINTATQNGSTASVAIYGNNVENITIENGEIFGFFRGIFLSGTLSGNNFNVGHVIQGMRVAYCLYTGIFLEYASNSVVQNCQVSSVGTTGGGTVVNSGAYAIPIVSYLGGNRVYRCQVLGAGYGFFGNSNGIQGTYWEQNLATNCTYSFYFFQTKEAYRDNASFGATTAAFTSGNDLGGNHSQ